MIFRKQGRGQFFNVRVDDKDTRKKLLAFEEAGPEGTKKGLFALGTAIFADSQLYVPVDTGTLKSSGGIEGPYENEHGDPEVLIYYGGASAPYALFVHEDLESYHVAPTQAKFLEGPFIAHVQGVETKVGLEMARELKKRGAY